MMVDLDDSVFRVQGKKLQTKYRFWSGDLSINLTILLDKQFWFKVYLVQNVL